MPGLWSTRFRMLSNVAGNNHDTVPFGDFPLGSTLLLLPNHSSLAANCFDLYHVVDEDDQKLSTNSDIVDTWRPVKGWA